MMFSILAQFSKFRSVIPGCVPFQSHTSARLMNDQAKGQTLQKKVQEKFKNNLGVGYSNQMILCDDLTEINFYDYQIFYK